MPISLQIQMQLAKLRRWRRWGRWTLWLMEDGGMTQKKFGKTSAVTFGSSDLNMHFCLEALRLSRAQPMPIKSNQARCHTTFEANFKTNYQPKNWSNFLTPVGRHFAPCVLDPKFRLFLEIFTFYTSQATVKKIDVFPFQQTSSNFQQRP